MTEYNRYGIIAVDFDGTLCEDRYPYIGQANEELINSLIFARSQGSKLILWTCRNNEELDNAIMFCKYYGLEFDAVNENVPEVIERYGGDSRKIYADIYLDDKAKCIVPQNDKSEEIWEKISHFLGSMSIAKDAVPSCQKIINMNIAQDA